MIVVLHADSRMMWMRGQGDSVGRAAAVVPVTLSSVVSATVAMPADLATKKEATIPDMLAPLPVLAHAMPSREAIAHVVTLAASPTPKPVATTEEHHAHAEPALPSRRENAIVAMLAVSLMRWRGLVLPALLAPPGSATPSNVESATVEMPADSRTSLAKSQRMLALPALVVCATPSREMSATVEITVASVTRPRVLTMAVDIKCGMMSFMTSRKNCHSVDNAAKGIVV